MAYTFKGKNGETIVNGWDDVLSKTQSGYQLKADKARRGVTMTEMAKQFGPLPTMYGKVGYNPNLNNTDPDIVKILKAEGTRGARKSNASTVTKTTAPAPTNAMSNTTGFKNGQMVGGEVVGTVKPNSNGGNVVWTGKGWDATSGAVTAPRPAGGVQASSTPTRSLNSLAEPTVADSALAAKQKAYAQMIKSPPAGIPAAAWPEVVRQNLGLTAGQTQNVDNALGMAAKPGERMASDVVSDAVYSRDNDAAAAFKPVQDQGFTNQTIANKRNEFEAEVGGDPRAMKAYDQAMAAAKQGSPQEVIAAAGLARTEALRTQSMPGWTDGANDFLTNNPLGQMLAPVLAVGGGVAAGAAAGGGVAPHFGSGMPATPGPDPAGLGDSAANASDYLRTNPEVMEGMPGYNESVVSNQTLSNPSTAQYGPAPSSGPSGPSPTGTPVTGGTTAPDGAALAAAGGAGAAGNWWENPAAMAAIVAAVGGGTSLIQGQAQADAATRAAQLQADGAQKAIDAQKAMYDQTRDDLAPWRTAGATALTDLQNFDETPFQFNTTPGTEIDPSYSFRLGEGMKALENSAAARGNLLSGNTMKGISDYGQQSASQEYNNAFNRYQTQRGTKLNRLQSLAGVGQTAVQQSQQAGQNYANNAGNMITGGANAQAQGMTDSANASGLGWMGVTNNLMSGLNNYYQQQQNNDNRQMINALIGGR